MKNKILAFANALFLLATLVVNYLATSLPIGGRTTGELSDLYPNLFVPAGFTFSIWGIIYLLLIGFVVRQLIDAFVNKPQGLATKLSPWFLLSCLANMGWIFAWHYTKVELSLVLMLLLLASLIVLVSKTNNHTPKKSISWKEKILVESSFGVYLGWISVATIANSSALLVDMQRDMFGMTEIFWTVVVILVACSLGVLALWRKANVPYALVILWAFYGIFAKRMAIDPIYANTIITVLWFCSVLLAGGIGFKWKHWIKN